MIRRKYIYFNSLERGYGDRKIVLCSTRDTDA